MECEAIDSERDGAHVCGARIYSDGRRVKAKCKYEA